MNDTKLECHPKQSLALYGGYYRRVCVLALAAITNGLHNLIDLIDRWSLDVHIYDYAGESIVVQDHYRGTYFLPIAQLTLYSDRLGTALEIALYFVQ